MKNTLIVIDGPTASGKSNLAYNWAKIWNCPILSADSRQLFKQVDIGTGKPEQNQLKTVQHYFMDTLPVDSSYSVGQFQRDANELLLELFGKHNKLILCGGTGLYIKSILKGLDNLPESNREIKDQVAQMFLENGIEGYQSYLEKADPAYFATVDKNNPRRLARAIEVILLTGKPYSSFKLYNQHELPFQVSELTLMPARNTLYTAIEKRVDFMIKSGLVDETKSLLQFRNCQALDTVGYKEIISYLDGNITLEVAINLIKQHTRNYAKRQITWFKKESQGNFIDPENKQAIETFFNLFK
ncbi:MAG: tRNA (adenosine(37)-N6)-dimethylallyltransferase MiaA [Saprospiraceae bacterium]|nr:tRNA (adenosine(37)-N6)-dimethylallyltransferase MiaA [Saprospiraceae bacterium]